MLMRQAIHSVTSINCGQRPQHTQSRKDVWLSQRRIQVHKNEECAFFRSLQDNEHNPGAGTTEWEVSELHCPLTLDVMQDPVVCAGEFEVYLLG